MAEKELTPKTVYVTLGGFSLLAGASTLILYFLGIQYETVVSLCVTVIAVIATFGFWTYQRGRLNLAIGIGAIVLGGLYLLPLIELLSSEAQFKQKSEEIVGLWSIAVLAAALFVISFLHLRKRKEREPLKQVWRSVQWFYLASFGISIVLLSLLKIPVAYAGMVLGSYVALSGLLKGVWETRSHGAEILLKSNLKKMNLKTFFRFALESRESTQPLIKKINLFELVALGTLGFGIYGFGNAGMTQQLVYSGLVICFHTVFVLSRFHAKGRELLAEENARVNQELRTAHDMQMGLMPKEDPIVPGFDISGICLPANDVGGDFFDYVWLDRKRTKLGIAVADVSGKAMKAAITAVMTSGMIYREAGGNESPKTILRNINRPLYTKLDSRMFTALSFAVIDTRKKELRFSNAGQSYPLLNRGKEVRSLEVKGARLPLGVKEDVTYGEMAVKLKKGDTLIFYTDGIPEAKDEKDEFYGFERFKSLMENMGGLLAKEMRDRILSEVKSFTGNAPQHDDMTVVVVKVG